MDTNKEQRLQKQAGALGAGLEIGGRALGPAAYFLLAMPAVMGAGAGWIHQKAFKQPSKQDFRNVANEHMLAKIKAQKAEAERMRELEQAGEEEEEDKQTVTGAHAAKREIPA